MVALLYPFSWQHTFIPVLPASMIDIVCCPTPFLVGLLSSSLPKLKELPVEEVGHCLGDQLGEGWRKEGTEGTETPGREGGAEGERKGPRPLGSSHLWPLGLSTQVLSLFPEHSIPGWSYSCCLTLGIQEVWRPREGIAGAH